MENRGGSTQEAQAPDQASRRLRRRHIAIVLAIAAVCIAVCFAGRVPERVIFLFDRSSRNGSLAGMTDEERLEYLQDAVDKSRFSFRINGNMTFASGDAEGVLFIANPEDNSCLLKVTITLDDDGRTLYETGLIKPGTGVGKDKLDIVLPRGEYKATAEITACEKGGETIGTARAGIRITIRS